MASGANPDLRAVDQLRGDPVIALGLAREGAQYVAFGHRGGGGLQFRQLGLQGVEDLLVEMLLAA